MKLRLGGHSSEKAIDLSKSSIAAVVRRGFSCADLGSRGHQKPVNPAQFWFGDTVDESTRKKLRPSHMTSAASSGIVCNLTFYSFSLAYNG